MIIEAEVKRQCDLAMQALKDSAEIVTMKIIYVIPKEPLEMPDGKKMETFGGLQFNMPECWKELNLDNDVFSFLMRKIAKEAIAISGGEKD